MTVSEYTLQQWLRERRGRLKEMAETLDINYSWISQIASGRKKAPLDTAIKISALPINKPARESFVQTVLFTLLVEVFSVSYSHFLLPLYFNAVNTIFLGISLITTFANKFLF